MLVIDNRYYSAIKKKKRNSSICNNMVRPWGHFAKWNKSDRKTNTVWVQFYVESNKTIGLREYCCQKLMGSRNAMLVKLSVTILVSSGYLM